MNGVLARENDDNTFKLFLMHTSSGDIWEIAWEIWGHRNNLLHGENSDRIHEHDLNALRTSIIE